MSETTKKLTEKATSDVRAVVSAAEDVVFEAAQGGLRIGKTALENASETLKKTAALLGTLAEKLAAKPAEATAEAK